MHILKGATWKVSFLQTETFLKWPSITVTRSFGRVDPRMGSYTKLVALKRSAAEGKTPQIWGVNIGPNMKHILVAT